MTIKAKLAASTSTPSFAHLVGRAPAAAAAAEDDPPRREGESDEDYDKRAQAAAEEDKQKEGEDDEKHKARVAANRMRRAQEDPPDETAAGPDDDKGDDDSDGGDMRREGIGQARLRERARCAAIFADPAAAHNPALAATLAFTTDMPRSQAIRVLRAGGTVAVATTPAAAPRRSLDARMAALPAMPVLTGAQPPAAGGAPKDQAYQTATLMLVANMKRLGEGPEAIAKFIAERNAA